MGRHAGIPSQGRRFAAVNEETDLGRVLMESGRRSTAPSPFFSESVARTVKEITEDAGIAGATPGVSDEIGRMPLVNGDERFHEADEILGVAGQLRRPEARLIQCSCGRQHGALLVGNGPIVKAGRSLTGPTHHLSRA